MAAADRGLVRKLAEWDTGGLPVTTLYLDVDGRRHPHRGDYLLRAEDLLRKAGATAPRDRAPSRSVSGDVELILRFLNHEFDRRGLRGVVAFSCAGAGLWEEVPMPHPVRDRAVIRPRPYLLPLEAAVERSETFCVAIVDRHRARILRGAPGEVEEITHLLDEVPDHDGAGWPEPRRQRHIEDHVVRHLKHVADVLLRHRERAGFDHLVLAGPHEVVAELERDLHDYLRRAVVDRASLPMSASVGEVAAHVGAVEERLEREREQEAVRTVASGTGAGRAVAGLGPTLEALEAGRVATLVVGGDLQASGMRCPSCGHLAEGGVRCPLCGSDMEGTPDLLEEAVEAALVRGARVETVRTSDMGPMRVGALLRY